MDHKTATNINASDTTLSAYHDEVLRLREALKNIAKPGYGIQGIAEDYGHDPNAYNYHAMLYWKSRAEQMQIAARSELSI